MEWTKEKISSLVKKQREYFRTNETLSVSFRISQLKKLRDAIKRNEQNIIDALKKDLNRAPFESYFCDIGDILYELNETIHGLKKWAKPETHRSGLIAFPSTTTKVYKMPYGVALIISPFNFPFMLSLGVLVCAIAGGNTAVIKASSKSKHSTDCLIKIISETFDEKYNNFYSSPIKSDLIIDKENKMPNLKDLVLNKNRLTSVGKYLFLALKKAYIKGTTKLENLLQKSNYIIFFNCYARTLYIIYKSSNIRLILIIK